MEKQSRFGEKKGAKASYSILAAFFGLVFLFGCVLLISHTRDLDSYEKKMQDIRNSYIRKSSGEYLSVSGNGREKEALVTEGALSGEDDEPGFLEKYNVPEKQIDFAGLQEEQNPDIYAWITVPGTKVDYPVLQHPEEMDYYLEHNIDGSKGFPGCVYSQLINSRDWTDKHTVLYGHNAQKGIVFNTLHYYEDPGFFGENPYIYIYTEEKIYVYRIFAAYESDDIHLLLGIDIDTPEKYQEYFDGIFCYDGCFDKEIAFTPENSRILTLSTCISGKPSRRFLVQAILEAEGENG